MSNEIETILFSAGMSIAFLMLIGFLTNALGTCNFISKPLSTYPLIIIVNIAITLMCFFSCVVNKENLTIAKTKELNSTLILPYSILPFLSVIGVLLFSIFNNNFLLIFAIILIPIAFVLSLFNLKLSSHYPLIIVSIALTLLLSNTLITRYPYGDDINFEFNVFTLTNKMAYWNPNNYTDYDQFSYLSMLSVTIFPMLLSKLLNIEGIWVFKIIFPIIFSFVPLALYQLYQIQWGKKAAFISAVFFMANYAFFQILITNAKQMTAELFYVLLFLIMLGESRGRGEGKWIIYIFLVFGLVVSHYSMNYIFLFTMLFAWFFGKIFLKNNITKIETINVVFLSCFTFLWYTYIVHSPFYRLTAIIETTFNSFLKEFFSWGARGELVQTSLGIMQAPSILHNIGVVFHNITSFFILIGFISLIIMWKKGNIPSEYGLIASFNMVLLLSAIFIPRFAGFLEMDRLHHVALIFLSPLFVLGAGTFINAFNLRKEKKKERERNELYSLALISIVLVAFFLFQTGFIYEVAGDSIPSSISLSKYKMEYSYTLIHESDVFSAMWLSRCGDVEHVRTYADTRSATHVLTSYSSIRRDMMLLMANTTEEQRYPGIMCDVTEGVKWGVSYIYLSKFNIIKGMVVYNPRTHVEYSLNELPIFNSTGLFNNRIYSNGAGEIYYRTD
jgi:uncharacterized membrane protein